MGDVYAAILLVCLGLVLVSAGIEDARRREIANWKNAAIALLAPVWWWANGLALWPDLAIQLGVALLVFGFFLGAYALGQMGGGDVKMIGALALWLPAEALIWMLVLMSLLGGALTLLLLIDKRVRRSKHPLEIPYGIAIAIAALLVIGEPNFNHFG